MSFIKKPTRREAAQAMYEMQRLSAGIVPGKSGPTMDAPKPVKPRKVNYDKPDERNEQDVKREGIGLLRKHPKIAVVCAHNSGAATFGEAFVKFNHVYVKGKKDVRLVDCVCFMTNGGVLAIDWKTPLWVEPNWMRLIAKELMDGPASILSKDEERELAQKRFLDCVMELPNGIGLFVNDVQILNNQLEGI